MYNLQYENDFLIPTVYVEDPYAYLIIDKDTVKGSVKGFGYRRDVRVEMGFHDQCIFLVNTSIVKDKLKNIIKSKDKKYKELNFLDVVNDIDNGKVAYYETKYPLKSFNTFNDIPSSTNL